MGPILPQSGAIIDSFKKIFPLHGRKVLAGLLGLSDGAARKKLTGERDLSVDELATLLRSEHGFQILSDMMADARPQWWSLCAPLMQAAEARRLQHAAQKKIQSALRGALNADTDLSATINRAEAALSFQDEDFMRAHLDGLRAQSRVQNSPVASLGKRGRQ